MKVCLLGRLGLVDLPFAENIKYLRITYTLEQAVKRAEVQLYFFFDLDARRCGWTTPRPGRFTPGKDPIPIVQEAGCVPGPFWTGAENLASTEIRSPDRPARNESLYRLSYSGQLEQLLIDLLAF